MGKKTRIRNILKIISGDNDEELMKFIKEKNLIRGPLLKPTPPNFKKNINPL